MNTYETSATVEAQGEVRVAGVPFAPGTFSPLVFTLQPAGTTLEPPAPLTIPNHFPGLPDGTIVDIFGLDTSPGGTGGFIDIGPDGISIVGTMVKINSGGSSTGGGGCNPDSPQDAKEAKPTDPVVADDSKSGQKSAPDNWSALT